LKNRAFSSAGLEHYLDKVGVTGSNPVMPTGNDNCSRQLTIGKSKNQEHYFFSQAVIHSIVRIFFLFILTLVASFCSAQDVVKGIVVDSATFTPLPYVNIQLKSSPRGTSTDLNGSFSILASSRDTLIFSIVGYERLELPLLDYEASIVRLAEKITELKPITVYDYKFGNPYEGLFDDQNSALAQSRRRLPFYMSKGKKEKIRFERLKMENVRVKTYVDVVINNPQTKATLMKRFSLTEEQYYSTLTKFNERYYNVMYYLTSAELESFLNKFFESEH
jgi:hypothetical protein